MDRRQIDLGEAFADIGMNLVSSNMTSGRLAWCGWCLAGAGEEGFQDELALRREAIAACFQLAEHLLPGGSRGWVLWCVHRVVLIVNWPKVGVPRGQRG